ncbi:hypothetical protein AOCH_000267, partial [Aspergillus ochraceoroseus]
ISPRSLAFFSLFFVMQPQGVKKSYKPARRSRVPLSCDPCRTRKLKCNREQPCQNCVTRNEAINCRYRGSKVATPPVSHPQDQGDPMQQRIDHLEDLVKRLITQQQELPAYDLSQGLDTIPPRTEAMPTPVVSEIPSGPGLTGSTPHTTIIDGVHSVYKGSDDWHDVLREINELKKVWGQTQDSPIDYDSPPSFSNIVDGSSFLFGHVKPMERIEILATFPPKPEVDKLIRQFFDRKTLPITVPAILHEPTFMREYAEHWKEPSKTNIIWLGLLFSILGIVMLSYHQYGEPPEYEGLSESLFQLYRLRTAHCLLTGDIAKCLPYTLETLRFNATAELNRRDDNSRGLWIMTGVIVRAAINMGYHRDPGQSSSITPVQAEYRRRVWLSIISMDDVASFLAGFPRMFPAIYSDTREPRNLHDWELSDESPVLPPSRPLTEPTETTYLIVKGRLFRALGRVPDLQNTPNATSYHTVLEIDKALYNAYQDIPPHMKVLDASGNLIPFTSKSDFSNLQLESMYHYGMCTLHRQFIAKGRIDPQFNLSQSRCISSALTLLGFQHAVDPSWYKFPQTRRMLTLAGMLLFLELEYRRRDHDPELSPASGILLQTLEKSCGLWADAQTSCDEAREVYQILSGMLSTFRPLSATSSSEAQSPRSHFDPSPPFQWMSGNLSLEKDLFAMSNDMDIDWVCSLSATCGGIILTIAQTTWDALIERASFLPEGKEVAGMVDISVQGRPGDATILQRDDHGLAWPTIN